MWLQPRCSWRLAPRRGAPRPQGGDVGGCGGGRRQKQRRRRRRKIGMKEMVERKRGDCAGSAPSPRN
eukprot:3697495-Lingulodinium_polyedra.AAC.1